MIVLIEIILWFVLISWVWKVLRTVDDIPKKIIIIIVSISLMLFITFIIFSISKIGIDYTQIQSYDKLDNNTNKKVVAYIRKMILMLFTPINGMLCLPSLFNLVNDIRIDKENKNIEKNKKKAIIIAVIFFIAIIIELNYFKNIQNGVIENFKLKMNME